jgi:8-oxo-dGTP pyrophosphatase MutT (NUDIX family)
LPAQVVDALIMAQGSLALPTADDDDHAEPAGPWASAIADVAIRLAPAVDGADTDLHAPHLSVAPPPTAITDGGARRTVLRILRRNSWQQVQLRVDQRRVIVATDQPPVLPLRLTGCAGVWRVLGWRPDAGIVQIDADGHAWEAGPMLSELGWHCDQTAPAQALDRWRHHFAGDAAVAPRLVRIRAGAPALARWQQLRLGRDQQASAQGISFRSSARDALIAWLLGQGELIEIVEPADLKQAHAAAIGRMAGGKPAALPMPSTVTAKPPAITPATPVAMPSASRRRYGGVMVSPDRSRVLLRRPAQNPGYDDLAWTWAKGTPDPGESPQDAARREAREETGQDARLLKAIPGWWQGSGSTATAYWLMEPVGAAGAWDPAETEAVRWATWDEAAALISGGRNKQGMARDLGVLHAARALAATLR